MKYYIFYFALLITSLSCAQIDTDKKERHKLVYTSENNFEFFFNSKRNFSNQKIVPYKGFGLEFNSFHGFFFTKTLSFQLGVGLAFNVNENFQSIPVVAQLKYNFYGYKTEGPYILLNTGVNLRVGNFEKGQSSKLGLGYVLESDFKYNFIIGAYAKSKTYVVNKQTNFNYQTDGYGLSIGIQF